MAVPAHLDEWTGRGVTVSQIERELARLRFASARDGPDLRTSVMTHVAWVPEEWLPAARATLAGLAERHPSRTLLLVPEADAEDRLDAELALQCFPVEGGRGQVCSEVIELHLGGRRALAPASIVVPLLLSDLPAFLRWRGEPPFGGSEFGQLVDAVDRVVVDSAEWRELPGGYARLAEFFERAAVSDIAWARTLDWRRAVAALWPGVAEARELRVVGPRADALLLAGWLRSRLDRGVELVHDEAETLARVELDGRQVGAPPGPRPSASDLLSYELERFVRDPVYEQAAEAASK